MDFAVAMERKKIPFHWVHGYLILELQGTILPSGHE
jgi:hypothetical protein